MKKIFSVHAHWNCCVAACQWHLYTHTHTHIYPNWHDTQHCIYFSIYFWPWTWQIDLFVLIWILKDNQSCHISALKKNSQELIIPRYKKKCHQVATGNSEGIISFHIFHPVPLTPAITNDSPLPKEIGNFKIPLRFQVFFYLEWSPTLLCLPIVPIFFQIQLRCYLFYAIFFDTSGYTIHALKFSTIFINASNTLHFTWTVNYSSVLQTGVQTLKVNP